MAGPLYENTHRPSKSKLALADRIAVLQSVQLFEGAAKRHLRECARHSRIEQFGAGQQLMAEGQPSTCAFVVLAGTAVVRRNGRKIAEVGPGEIVGELGLLLDRPRNATVRATTPVECLALDRSALKATVSQFPNFGWQLLETIAARLTSSP